jgi:hypothetical protein
MRKGIFIGYPDQSGSISQESVDAFFLLMKELLENHPPVNTIVIDSMHLHDFGMRMSEVDADDFIGFPVMRPDGGVIDDRGFPYAASIPSHEHGTLCALSQKEIELYNIHGGEIETVEDILRYNNCKSIEDFMKLEKSNPHWSHEVLRGRYTPPIIKKCDCGAKHTSFPNHHYHWCQAKC